MNYVQFVKTIKEKIENSYVVCGDDIFLLDQVEDKTQKACGIEMSDFDKIVLDDENFSCQSLQTALLQLPLLARKKLVIIKNLAKLNESDKKQIKDILNKKYDACAMFFANNDGEDFSFLTDVTKIDCSRLSDEMCSKFIVDRLSKKDCSITNDACKKLIELCSNNLGKIQNELEKLTLMTLDKKLIELKDVESSVKSDLEYKIYEISDLLICKNIDRALIIVEDLLTKKEEPTTILSMLTSNFRRLYFSKITPDDNATLARNLGVKEYAIKIAKEKQSKLSATALKEINDLLLELDYMIKSGEMPADIALNYAIFEINSKIKK